jgi:predicted Zn-dependent peptidase
MRRHFLLVAALLCGPVFGQDITLPEFERVVLDNGTVLLLAEKHDVPLVGMRAVVRGGTVADPSDRVGLGALVATLLQKGAGDRDAAAFADAAAGVGGTISARVSTEVTSVSAEFLSRDAALMVALVADMLMRPVLAEEEFEKERDRNIALIQAAKGSNLSALMPAYSNAFIFNDHPYGNPSFGSEESLAEISHDDLLDHYARHFGGDRLTISVVGDFDINAMRARLRQVFGAWAPAGAEPAVLDPATAAAGRRVLLVDKPGAVQTYFWIGNVGVARDYHNRAGMNIANTLFGGRFTSMLMTALRVEAGLTYRAGSSVAQHTVSGATTIQSFTETLKTVEAIDLALEILGRLHARGVDEEMVTSARNYIMGQFPPTLETASSLAATLADLEVNGLGREHIDEYSAALLEATPVSVHNAISDVYPTLDNLVFVLIGDADAIRDDVAKYGPVTEVPITEPRFRVDYQ